MYFSYLLLALHSLRKNPTIGAIKILSLTLGLSCSILVVLHVSFIYSFDKHIPNWENIYRIAPSTSADFIQNAEPWGAALASDYPQIANVAKIRPGVGLFKEDQNTFSNDFFWVDPKILDIFSIEFVAGDKNSALTQVNSIVINQSTARKFFGDESPLGKTITFDNRTDLRVTGVIRDLPINTHIHFPILISDETGRSINGQDFMSNNFWITFLGSMTYVYIPSKDEANQVIRDLGNFLERHLTDSDVGFAKQINLRLTLEPLSEIYLSPRTGFNSGGPLRAKILLGLFVFSFLILTTSCVNFANLSMTQIRQRTREIGIRKTLGATKSDIVVQFLMESLLYTGFAIIITLPLVYFALPLYTNITGTEFTLTSLPASKSIFLLIFITLGAGLMSGLVPAIAVSRLQISNTLKNAIGVSKVGNFFRYLITIFQFAISITLATLAIAIVLLIDHLNQVEVGFNPDNLLILDTTYSAKTTNVFTYNQLTEFNQFNYESLIRELSEIQGVFKVGRSQWVAPNTGGYNAWRRTTWPIGKSYLTSHYAVDENYIDALQLKLIAGRGFSLDFPADILPEEPDRDEIYGLVITESAAKAFEFSSAEEALGKVLEGRFQFYRIVGVVEDFKLSGGMEDPLRLNRVLQFSKMPLSGLAIRIDPSQTQSTVEEIETVWAKYRPGIPIDMIRYSQFYDRIIYEKTNSANMAALISSIITLFIASMGLYALSSYSCLKRTKEIGIRKVVGASTWSIVLRLVWDFIKPILVACVVAAFASYTAIQYFYSQFNSFPNISILLYLSVSIAAVLFAVITVCLQSYKAASENPIRALRYE